MRNDSGKINLKLVVSLITSFLFIGSSFGQITYCVIKHQGTPLLNQNELIFKGAIFSPGDTLELKQEDYVLLVGPEGYLYELKEPEIYSYSELNKYRRQSSNESFMLKYFSYLWKQLTEQDKVKQHIGVVYRERMVPLLLTPSDEVNLLAPQIEFSWVIPEKTTRSYFFLNNLETGQTTKFGLIGNSLLLYVDGSILESGKEYKWSVASEPFPDLKKLNYYSFKLLTTAEFKELEPQLFALQTFLKAMGYTVEEISAAICNDFKYCIQKEI